MGICRTRHARERRPNARSRPCREHGNTFWPICGFAARGRSDRRAGGMAPTRAPDCRPRLDWLIAQATGEARDRPGAEMVRVVDQGDPPGKSLPIEIAVLQRVAEQ